MSRCAGLFSVAIGVLLAGCGPEGPQRAEVSGAVKFNGEPIAEGAINFFPVEGTKGPEAGAAIKDGKYHIPRAQGPVVGKNRVELKYFGNTGRTIQDPTAPPGTMVAERSNLLPPEFNTNSTLVREVKPRAADNVFDFDIPKTK